MAAAADEDFLQIIVKHTSMAQFTLGKDKKITGHTKIRELKRMIADRVGSTPQDLRFLNGAQELTNDFDEKTLIDLDIGDLS
jgi:hypothetical protein